MKKILIIEDELVVARMYEKLFTFGKYDAVVAIGGKEGLKQAAKSQPALILLDILMPVMNGLEVLEKLKKDPKTKSIPVVMLTNVGEEEIIGEAHNLGAAGYIIKSDFEPTKLLKIVESYLH